MEGCPFGPWVTDSKSGSRTVKDGPLKEGGVLDSAAIYHALFTVSQGRIGPRDADEMLIWEIAVLLGVSKELESESDSSASDDWQARGVELARQRAAYARGEGEKPEARPLSKSAFAAMSGALN